MSAHTLQYDMGLRVWVLTGPQGQTIATFLSRAAALRDGVVRSVTEKGGTLRIRNADGTFQPEAVADMAAARTRVVAVADYPAAALAMI